MNFKDIIKISAVLFVIHLGFFSFSMFYILKNIYENRTIDQIKFIDNVSSSIQTQLDFEKSPEDKVKRSCQLLETKLNAHEILFFYFEYQNVSCSGPEEYPRDNFNFSYSGRLLGGGPNDLYYKPYVVGDAKYAVGLKLEGKQDFIRTLFASHAFRTDLITEIIKMFVSFFLTNYLVIGLFLNEIKDQFRSANNSSSRFQKLILKFFSLFRISDLLKIQKASHSVISQKTSLESENRVFAKALTTKMLEEIKNKKSKIPYTFDAVIVRVDLNYFTKMFFSSPNEKMLKLIQEYSEVGFELLERYNGLLYQFVGDEVVVAFQDTETEDRYKLAISYIRDFFSAFGVFQFDMGDGVLRNFTIKASLANSKTTFYQLPFGYFYNGENLISSQRVLSMIDIKDHNVMSCLKKDAESIMDFVEGTFEEKEVLLKNYPQASELILFDKFTSLEKFYNLKSDLTQYFRSDNAIIFYLKQLIISDNANQDFILRTLSIIKPHDVKPEVAETWKQGIKELLKDAPNLTIQNLKFLATYVSLARNLIPNKNWTTELTNELISIPQDLDLRLNANIIEVLGDKLSIDELNLFWKTNSTLKSDRTYRPDGNILLLRALHKLEAKTTKDILFMLKSENILQKHTGVYVAIEVIKYYRRHNPAELEVSQEIQDIIKILNNMKDSEESGLSNRLNNLLGEI